MIRLTGLPIAITGASSGIGRATALACARAGMPVAVAARRLDRLVSLAAEISVLGGRALAVRCDVTSPDECRDLVERTVAEFGSIYAVFANAGIGLESAVRDTADADLRELFEVNFFGTINTIRPALDRMVPARRGHVLVCSSCLSELGVPFYGAYCATKAAQHRLAQAVRAEVAAARLRVSTIHPPLTATEFGELAAARSGVRSRLADRVPRFSVLKPDRVARSVVRCLRRPRPEVWPSTLSRLALVSARWNPRAADRILAAVAAKRPSD